MPALATTLRDWTRTILHGGVDALLPQTCLACGTWVRLENPGVCPDCQAALDRLIRAHVCPRCGRTARPETIYDSGCAACRREQFWNVRGVARIGSYSTPLDRLTTRLKYGGRERNADFLADLMAESLSRYEWFSEVEALVPVPMHWRRRLQRPCDHALLLTVALARRTGVPMVNALRRVKHTPSQTRMTSRTSRFKNVSGCFAPRRSAKCLVGGTVCVVDNLLMSGATVCEVSKALRRAGAKRIYAAVIVRTVAPGDFELEPDAASGEDRAPVPSVDGSADR
ncbi:MAG: hypothetical protein KKB50_21240 [Planctomycetes bacterium]|nr:hypothetical protein [Planctomycetota bacterium]